MDAARVNTDTAFDRLKALFSVKTLPEAISVQTDHSRKQYAAISFQITELTTLAQKVAIDAASPFRAGATCRPPA